MIQPTMVIKLRDESEMVESAVE